MTSSPKTTAVTPSPNRPWSTTAASPVSASCLPHQCNTTASASPPSMEKSPVTPSLMVHPNYPCVDIDQTFVDVLEEIASTRNWSGEAVELLVHETSSGEEYRLNSGNPLYPCLILDNQESEWRYAALTPDAAFT